MPDETPANPPAPPPVFSRKVTITTPRGLMKLEAELHGDKFSLRKPPAGKQVVITFEHLWRIHTGEWL